MWEYGGGGGGGGGSSSYSYSTEEATAAMVTTTAATVSKPAWLQGLMSETFFEGCGVHENRRKNEKNIFCLDCCHSFCSHCLPSHPPPHPLLQVRRYVYQDVVRLDDLEKLIDCSFIQPYTINSAKVIFLNQRAQSNKNGKNSGNPCWTCDRILQDPFHFCSLSCKVDNMEYEGEDLSSILHTFQDSDFTFSQQFEGLHMDYTTTIAHELLDMDGQITPNSILESPLEYGTSSTSSYNLGGNSGISTTRKKKSREFNNNNNNTMFSLSNNRRKSAPRRSPMS